MKLYHKSYGNGGTPLLIAHGLFGMADNWHLIAGKLQSDFHVITVDLRNHGRSPHASEMSYADMVQDVAELIDTLKLNEINLLGHSMGGKMAMTFANEYPHLLKKLMVADISPDEYAPGHAIYFKALLEIDQHRIEKREEAENILRNHIQDQVIIQFLMKSLYRTTEGNYRLRMNTAAIYQHYDEIRGAIPFHWPVSHPTRFIRGSESPYIRQKDEDLISEWFTHYDIDTIPGAGHWVHADQPDLFVQSVRDFLQG